MTEYELNRLPETESGKRMISRVSPVYDNSYFIKRFYDALGTDFDTIRRYFESLRKQSFIDTVDWGIDYQELKYSLDLRPDLTLEERRARLGIKARQHLPLNPAVLEKFILDNYDTKTYLDEGDPGYIHAHFNRVTWQGFNNTIDFLLREKPAHLDLDATVSIPEFIGGNEPGDDCPRVFFGVATFIGGVATIAPATIRDDQIIMHAGVATFIGGEITINPAETSATQ